MSKITYFAAFSAGVIVGAAAVWKYAHKQADEEIQSVKEAFSCGAASAYTKKVSEIGKSVFQGFNDGLSDNEKTSPELNKYVGSPSDAPYIIAQEEFGKEEDFDTITLYYHSDDVLTDTDNEVTDDIDNTVGQAALRILRESKEDSITVRNKKMKCDYEILIDHTAYSED